MMRCRAGRLVAWLGPLLLLGLVTPLTACGSSGTGHATRDLNHRLQTRLATDVASGQAALRPLPAGAQVTLPPPTGFVNGSGTLNEQEVNVLQSVIEGLLDPNLMRIDVADPAAATNSLPAARLRSVTQYFVDYGLGPSVRTVDPSQAMPAGPVAPSAAGLTITVNLVCPPPHGGIGYRSGQVDPSCR